MSYLLTTVDNPWSPVTDYDEWDNYVATMNSLGLQELTAVYQSVYDRTR